MPGGSGKGGVLSGEEVMVECWEERKCGESTGQGNREWTRGHEISKERRRKECREQHHGGTTNPTPKERERGRSG